MNITQATALVGGLSDPGKMPGYSYSISAHLCRVGGKLRKVKGSVCEKCYALKNRYLWRPNQGAMERRLKCMSNPRWVEAMAFLLNERAEKNPFFRWFDSGDLQSVAMLARICQVAEKSPTVKHWLPTREFSIVAEYVGKGGIIPRNLCLRLSSLMIDGPAPRALSVRLGVKTSGVTACHFRATCPATLTHGKCGECRKCWSRSVSTVRYLAH